MEDRAISASAAFGSAQIHRFPGGSFRQYQDWTRQAFAATEHPDIPIPDEALWDGMDLEP